MSDREQRRNGPRARLRCARCGLPIGADEPAWLEFEDGSLHPSTTRDGDGAARGRATRAWHVGCVTAE